MRTLRPNPRSWKQSRSASTRSSTCTFISRASRARSKSSSSCLTTAAASGRARAGRITRAVRIYLDDAGSAPVLPEVTAATRDVPAGNPSSPHAEGRAARAALDRARDIAAGALGASRNEITFVSSGTEAVNLALFGIGGRLVTWAAEHQAVLGAARRMQAQGRDVAIAPVDRAAGVDVAAIKPGDALVSVGLANNEVGTIQPVEAVIA